MYVDDLVSGSNTIENVEIIKQKFTELFQKVGFNLHKWHSNIPSLQSSSTKYESELIPKEKRSRSYKNIKSALE